MTLNDFIPMWNTDVPKRHREKISVAAGLCGMICDDQDEFISCMDIVLPRLFKESEKERLVTTGRNEVGLFVPREYR